MSACGAVYLRSGAGTWGQVVDASISESVFNMLEGCIAEVAMAGHDRPPSGSTISGELKRLTQ
jgi:crotonobetainyl-CoA:carnitine CoA-transferase CaiB-like acyl-CoA transferase